MVLKFFLQEWATVLWNYLNNVEEIEDPKFCQEGTTLAV